MRVHPQRDSFNEGLAIVREFLDYNSSLDISFVWKIFVVFFPVTMDSNEMFREKNAECICENGNCF
jgi:hypothetical protein